MYKIYNKKLKEYRPDPRLDVLGTSTLVLVI